MTSSFEYISIEIDHTKEPLKLFAACDISVLSIASIFFGYGQSPALVSWYTKYSILFCMMKFFLKLAVKSTNYNCCRTCSTYIK